MIQLPQQEFNIQEIQHIQLYQECSLGIYASYFDQQGNYIYTLGEYHKLKIYDLRRKSTKLIIFCRCECIIALRVCEKISTIVTCWEPGLLIIYKIETRNWKILKRQYIKSTIHFNMISNINQEYNHFACLKSDRSITIYNNYRNTFNEFQQLYDSQKVIRLNIIFLESKLICTNYGARFVEIYKFNQTSNRYEYVNKLTNKQPIEQIFGSFDRILILNTNKIFGQFIYNKEKEIFEQRGYSREKGYVLSNIKFVDQGNSFIEYGYSKKVKLWKFLDGELIISKTIEMQQNITTASVSQNKNALIFGLADGTIKIFT